MINYDIAGSRFLEVMNGKWCDPAKKGQCNSQKDDSTIELRIKKTIEHINNIMKAKKLINQ